jgi:spore germination cell wall hydrolase CwlJ-like protein
MSLYFYNKFSFESDDINNEDKQSNKTPQGFVNNINTSSYKAPSTNADLDDETILAKVICGESDGTKEGMLAVGTVIMNRVNATNRSQEFGGSTIKDVCNENAFECIKLNNSGYSKPSQKCLEAAREVLAGYRSFQSNVYFFRTASYFNNGEHTRGKKDFFTVGGNTYFTYEGYEDA